MLNLEPRHDRTLFNSVSQSRVGLDNNFVQVEGLPVNYRNFRGRNIQSKYVGYPDLPLIFNIDKYIQDSYVLQNRREDEINFEAIDNILGAYHNIAEEIPNHLIYARMYAYDYKCLDNYMDEHWEMYYIHKEDNVATLMNKTMSDMVARENLFDQPNLGARIYHNIAANIIIEVVNYDDVIQASDYFLTIGMMPMLFPSIKEKLNETELKYFKELVRRSQVKRIRNAEVNDYYYNLTRDKKYQDQIKEFKFKAELENILRARRRNYEIRLQEAINEKDQLFNRYQDVLQSINTYTMQLGKLENEDSFKEEIEMVMNMEAVRDFNTGGQTINITLVSNLSFYDPELLTITLERNPDNYNSDITNQFFKDVFIDEKYEYYVGQRYPFRLDEGRISLPQQMNYSIDSQQLRCLYNPHIQYYHCYGTNEPRIAEAHNNKDIVGYVNALLSSLKNVNFADSAVFTRWYRSIAAMLHGDVYDGDDVRTFITTKFLRDKESGEWISFEDYTRRYRNERRQAEEEAVELEPHIAGEEEAEW